MVNLDRHIFPATGNGNIWTIKRTAPRRGLIDFPHMANGNMYLIKKGAVKVCLFNEGKETILNFATEGDLVCNLISFFTGQPSQVYLEAIRKTELVGITKSDI